MPTADTLLKIDEERAVRAIGTYLRSLLHQHSVSGVLIGLSGGIDSAVLATLAIRSLGKDSVRVAYLYDRDSDKGLAVSARLVADWLGLDLETQNIEPALRKRRVYAPWVVRITGLSPFINRFLISVYRLMRDIVLVMCASTAGRRKALGERLQRLLQRLISKYIESGFRARHIYRREVLQKEALSRNLLLLSAANRSEYMLGWFSRGGIDDLPIQPLMGLYKTQVRQLARYLEVPASVRNQPPSPDMMKGSMVSLGPSTSLSRSFSF